MTIETEVKSDAVIETNDAVVETKVEAPDAEALANRVAALEADLSARDAKITRLMDEKKSLKGKVNEVETIETVRTQLEAEVTERDQKYSKLTTQLMARDVNGVIGAALKEMKCLSERIVTREIMDRIEASYDDEVGETKITVKDKDGKPMFIKGKDATITDLVGMLRSDPEFAPMFEGIEKGGTGAAAPRTLSNTADIPNPWLDDNALAERGLLKKSNPTLADRYKREAQAIKEAKRLGY